MPVITKPNQHFDTTTYTGNGGTQSITSLGFQPDFVWVKSRSTGSTNHLLEDVIRGTKKSLISNGTNAELTRGINAFLSNGFSFNDDASGDGNVSSQTYVAWNWKAGGAAVTNTSGSIQSQVSANPTAGFSVVTYTGNGTGGATIGHGLGAVPTFIIVKNRSSSQNWLVYSAVYGANMYGYLNLTNAWATDTTGFNNVTPTSTVFTVGSAAETNGSTNNLVAYCFTPIAGYSAFGSYTGNGSSDGPFVYTGFRPKFFMWKRSNTSGNSWLIVDASRSPYNTAGLYLQPDNSGAEGGGATMDLLSNGMKIQGDTTASTNGSGDTYIYMAFAESPFKYASAR